MTYNFLAVWLAAVIMADSDLIEQTCARLGIDEMQTKMGLGLIMLWTREHASNREYTILARAVPNWESYVRFLPASDRGVDGVASLAARFDAVGLEPRWIDGYFDAFSYYLEARGDMRAVLVLRRLRTQLDSYSGPSSASQ